MLPGLGSPRAVSVTGRGHPHHSPCPRLGMYLQRSRRGGSRSRPASRQKGWWEDKSPDGGEGGSAPGSTREVGTTHASGRAVPLPGDVEGSAGQARTLGGEPGLWDGQNEGNACCFWPSRWRGPGPPPPREQTGQDDTSDPAGWPGPDRAPRSLFRPLLKYELSAPAPPEIQAVSISPFPTPGPGGPSGRVVLL